MNRYQHRSSRYRYDAIGAIDVEAIGDSAAAVLERVGIGCENAELLVALGEAGARVDVESERAWFPRPIIGRFIESLRCEYAEFRRTPTGHTGRIEPGEASAIASTSVATPPDDAAGPRRFDMPALPGLGMQIAQSYHDFRRSTRRAGSRNDLVELVKLADVLDRSSPAGHALVQADVPPRMEALESALVLAEYAHRPGQPFAWFVDQIDYLREMGEVLGIPDFAGWGAVCFAHPFRFDRVVADKFVRRAREGFPTGLTAMPVSGVTTPVTVEGFVTVAAAEHLATWFAARAINPDVPLSGSIWAGTVDAATGAVSYSSFDAMRRAFACAQFVERWTGVEIAVGGGEYCDAKEPGLAAVYEKAYKAMTIAAFTGYHPQIGEGLLECGRVISPVELMLERDFSSGCALLAVDDEGETTTDAIGLEEIVEVGLGVERNHFTTIHTLDRFRSTLWLPELIDRGGWRGEAGDRKALEKAQRRVEDHLAEYRKPEGREEQLAKLREIVERARKRLPRS